MLFNNNLGLGLSTGTGIVGNVPIITILGQNPHYIVVSSTYSDAGATATDAEDGAITPIVESNNVNTAVLGTYSVQYSATDTDINTSYATRTVEVVASIPNIIYEMNSFYSDEELQAIINNEIIVASGVEILTDEFDEYLTDEYGEYLTV